MAYFARCVVVLRDMGCVAEAEEVLSAATDLLNDGEAHGPVCRAALTRDRAEALIRLRNAAAVHELDLIWMMRDMDLVSLHSNWLREAA